MSEKIKSYGFWDSSLRASDVAQSHIEVEMPLVLEGTVYWLETRPEEGGRCVLLCSGTDGENCYEVLPEEFSLRSRVHEYGGGAYAVDENIVIFSNDADQRVYIAEKGKSPRPVTFSDTNMRYGDFCIDSIRKRVICVREDHSGIGEPVNAIVSIPWGASDDIYEETLLVTGDDFYAAPRLSPDGTKCCWLSWNHPDMPWDSTKLMLADVCADGLLHNERVIAGGSDESVMQPVWSPKGKLFFVSDRTNWWNIYVYDENNGIIPLTKLESEFAIPHWFFGQSCYDIADEETLVCAFTSKGSWSLAKIDISSLEMNFFDLPFTCMAGIRSSGGTCVFTGGASDKPPSLVILDIISGEYGPVKESDISISLNAENISLPQPIIFDSSDTEAYGLYYPPCNASFQGDREELPPLIVMVHGGPTYMISTRLNLEIQYYTTRGFAVLDLNYRGSSGYGRTYRQQLNGQWGVADVDDACAGALHLADQGFADRNRMVIRGKSAGGYTTLAALTFRNVFRAGASHFGVSDCVKLRTETHKFESHYLDRLIAPYPQKKNLYIERSPFHQVEGLDVPVIFFQGSEDKVVPPNQAEELHRRLLSKGISTKCIVFDGEGHGFKKAENIQRVLEEELQFFLSACGIT